MISIEYQIFNITLFQSRHTEAMRTKDFAPPERSNMAERGEVQTGSKGELKGKGRKDGEDRRGQKEDGGKEGQEEDRGEDGEDGRGKDGERKGDEEGEKGGEDGKDGENVRGEEGGEVKRDEDGGGGGDGTDKGCVGNTREEKRTGEDGKRGKYTDVSCIFF